MVDFIGFGSVGGVRHAHQVAPLPRAQAPDVVPAAGAAAEAGNDSLDQRGAPDSGRGGQDGNNSGAGDGQTRGRALIAPEAEPLTGPPPAFDTTPLDVDTDLRLALARLNAGGYGRDTGLPAPPEQPVKPPGQGDQPAGGPSGRLSGRSAQTR